MKLHDLSIIIVIGIAVAFGIIGLVSTKFLGNDNAIEEVAEQVIQTETGLKLNLDLPNAKPEPAPTQNPTSS